MSLVSGGRDYEFRDVEEDRETDSNLFHGPNRVPVETFLLWTLIRDCLDFEHEEGSKLKHMLSPEDPIYATP